MRTWIGLAVMAALAVMLPGPSPTAAASGERWMAIDADPEDCQQIPPEETPPLAVATDPTLPLEARVMVEKGDRAVARAHLEVTKEAFRLIGIDLKFSWDVVTVPVGWQTDQLGGGPGYPEIMAFMKHHYGGRRPGGVDVVYFMTRHWSGGVADCIGGVRYPDRAFALGSIDYLWEGTVPIPTANEGVIAAHEIGHLLGAHHHYSNCAEALPQGAPRGDVNPCTTMWPLAGEASSTFSLMERSFVRSFAARFAKG